MNIVTVVNFLRSKDYRIDRKELLDAVKNQAELAVKYKMPTTFLFQHDALLDEDICKLIADEEYIEKGLWLEMNKNLVISAGGEWHSDKEWDWSSNVDLMCGYSSEIRKRIIDIAMNDFKSVFGYYPKTVGSWVLDAITLKYLDDNYDISASMLCKDQWGTDGYSLWGGYYNQAYYPNVNNAFCPSGLKNNQINIPIFRMLGSDPIEQYDCESDDNGQNVITMEPCCTEYGGRKDWVTWFMNQLIQNEPLSFGYVQVGQENSFGWSSICDGYMMQMQVMDELSKKGDIKLLTMHEAGEWYKNHYNTTPASVNYAVKDDKTALWYSNKSYRIGLYADENIFYIRDIMLFNDDYKERYLDDRCETKNSFYDNLPFVDGYRWSGKSKSGGMFFTKNGQIIKEGGNISYEKIDSDTIEITIKHGDSCEKIVLSDDCITVETENNLMFSFEENSIYPQINITNNDILLKYNNFDYKVNYIGSPNCDNYEISPYKGKITFKINTYHKGEF